MSPIDGRDNAAGVIRIAQTRLEPGPVGVTNYRHHALFTSITAGGV